MTQGLPILHPIPRRASQINTPFNESSLPSTPSNEVNDPSSFDAISSGEEAPSRTRSILNLTSSTLYGIYSLGDNSGTREDINTPWGTGSVTPQSPQTSGNRASLDEKWPLVIGADVKSRPQDTSVYSHSIDGGSALPTSLRTILLFIFGVAYGAIVTHLHDDQQLAPVRVEGIKRYSWLYLMFWGVTGVAIGSLLPWIDRFWEQTLGDFPSSEPGEFSKKGTRSVEQSNEGERPSSQAESGMGADWNPVVRSIGAFVGIAFAIRKLPWQSTLQVSLTLALVNPVLWYLIDRSKPGFILSALVGIAGTAALLGVNPDMVPPPSTPSPRANILNTSYEDVYMKGIITSESIGVGTWIASVLFCSCVCFGNIGRRLALRKPERSNSCS